MFLKLLESVALGTKATFSYSPTDSDIRQYLAVQAGKSKNAFKDKVLTDE